MSFYTKDIIAVLTASDLLMHLLILIFDITLRSMK
jgi:hypothetical protein